ncbi:MAG TPA: YdcF family protein [Labilithrix sp.]|nr:YdcF family protein [Labilithrix sp.]
MFFVLSKILDVLLSPYTWGLAFLVLAVPWRRPRSRTSWKRQRGFGAVGLAVLLVFSLEPVANRMAYRLEHSTTSTYRPDEVYDAVILLGGIGDERVAVETGQPAFNDNVERLVTTHRLLADGRARFTIVSGGPENVDLADSSEARVLGRQITAWGIDPSRVILEERARNTHENAVYSQRIAKERGFEKVLVVTSAFHMRRAAECFAAASMKVDTLAVDFRAHSARSPGGDSWLPRVTFLGESTKTLRETAGLYIYRWRGYGRPLD